MTTKTNGISSGLVATCYVETDVEENLYFSAPNYGYALVRLSDAEAIISDLQNLVIAENSRKQQLEEEVMWLKAAQPNIALIADKDATIKQQADVIEFQKKAWTADHEDLTSQISELEASPMSEEALDILRATIYKQSAALKMARSKVYSATICHPNGVQTLLDEALAAIDALGDDHVST